MQKQIFAYHYCKDPAIVLIIGILLFAISCVVYGFVTLDQSNQQANRTNVTVLTGDNNV